MHYNEPVLPSQPSMESAPISNTMLVIARDSTKGYIVIRWSNRSHVATESVIVTELSPSTERKIEDFPIVNDPDGDLGTA